MQPIVAAKTGFSLLEVMIGLSMITVISLGIASQIALMYKASSSIRKSNYIESIGSNIRTLFRDQRQCSGKVVGNFDYELSTEQEIGIDYASLGILKAGVLLNDIKVVSVALTILGVAAPATVRGVTGMAFRGALTVAFEKPLHVTLGVRSRSFEYQSFFFTEMKSGTSPPLRGCGDDLTPGNGAAELGMKYFTEDTQWIVPAGVTRVEVEVIGAAGGGSGGRGIGDGAHCGASGGAGGYFKGVVTVTPGSAIAITVGRGGQGRGAGETHGGDGGQTAFGTHITVSGAEGGKFYNNDNVIAGAGGVVATSLPQGSIQYSARNGSSGKNGGLRCLAADEDNRAEMESYFEDGAYGCRCLTGSGGYIGGTYQFTATGVRNYAVASPTLTGSLYGKGGRGWVDLRDGLAGFAADDGGNGLIIVRY